MSQHGAETTTRRETTQRIETFATRHRLIYLILISLFALIGYLYLFLFPAGVVMAVRFLIDAIPKAATTQDWEKIGAMISVALLCSATCLHILRLRQTPSTGIPLEREQAPELFKLVDSIGKHFGHRKILQVRLSDDFQVDIRKSPVLGFPLWFSHTLIIGLPLLQTVAPKHFRCELARRIAQHARRGHHITHRIFLARRLWNTYLGILNSQPRFGDQLLRWFFQLYTPLFDALSLPATRWNELAADSVILDFINDNDVFETIKVTTINSLFLTTHYWPKVRKMALNGGEMRLEPFAKLERLVRPTLQNIDGRKWLEDLRDAGLDPESPLPDFRQRMHNIGHTKIRDIPHLTATAAGLYLKDSHDVVVPAVDALWQTTTLPAWRADYEARRENIDTIRALSEMSHHGRLSLREIWRYARLAKDLKGNPRHRSILKLLRRNATQGKSSHISTDAPACERLNDIF